MRTIVGWCLANRSVVILFGLLLVGGGVFSIFRLNQELLPDITFPTVYIVTSDVGASPEVVDRDVSVPMADALTGLPHAKHVHSESSQGFSTVWIQFDLESNLKDDTDAVNQRLNQVNFPQSAGKQAHNLPDAKRDAVSNAGSADVVMGIAKYRNHLVRVLTPIK